MYSNELLTDIFSPHVLENINAHCRAPIFPSINISLINLMLPGVSGLPVQELLATPAVKSDFVLT